MVDKFQYRNMHSQRQTAMRSFVSIGHSACAHATHSTQQKSINKSKFASDTPLTPFEQLKYQHISNKCRADRCSKMHFTLWNVQLRCPSDVGFFDPRSENFSVFSMHVIGPVVVAVGLPGRFFRRRRYCCCFKRWFDRFFLFDGASSWFAVSCFHSHTMFIVVVVVFVGRSDCDAPTEEYKHWSTPFLFNEPHVLRSVDRFIFLRFFFFGFFRCSSYAGFCYCFCFT